MKEYFIRTQDGNYADIITAENTSKAIETFKTKHNLKRYRKFFAIESKYIFN